MSKVKYNGGKTRNDYNPILNANMKTIHLPVIEVNGDTSGVVIGVPSTIDGVVSYSIFYQNNQNVQRDAFGYYSGEISFDLFEGNTSYTAIFNPGSETITDTLIGGPRWVNNCSTCRMVVPTWECIEAQISYFEQRCTGWCKFRCKVSDTFLFGSCTGGAYLGAAVLCARTKNAIVM
ncbi:hypothetical protein HY58_09860 [Flavihumibacter sp. ZG627]|nr:hypothetical protein HY58_09860 [Flavihumibacter sp. ZG627]